MRNYEINGILSETLTLKNDVHEVTKLSSFEKALFEKIGLEDALASKMRLAVEEAVVNVMEYAYPIGEEGEIEVCMTTDGECLTVVVTDAGTPFDPTLKEGVDISLSAEERQIGGLGIHLLRALMDDVHYEYLNGRNTLTLTKRLKD